MSISITDFNRDVNNSGSLSDKFKSWSKYRENINRIIECALEYRKDATEIIIFGAGECNDLDLNYLSDRFERIVLTDVDTVGLNNGIRRQIKEEKLIRKFECLKVEYTGLEKIGFFEKLYKLTIEGSNVEDIINYIDKTLSGINNKEILPQYKNNFPIVISAPLYTQLIYTQLSTITSMFLKSGIYIESEISMMNERVIYYLPLIIRNYNDLLISVGDNNSLIGMWTDLLQDHPNGEIMKSICKKIDDTEFINQYVAKYDEKYGLGLGSYGKLDFYEKIDKVFSLWSIWPFDSNRSFLVYGSIGKVRK